jgi:hypothetical protein
MSFTAYRAFRIFTPGDLEGRAWDAPRGPHGCGSLKQKPPLRAARVMRLFGRPKTRQRHWYTREPLPSKQAHTEIIPCPGEGRMKPVGMTQEMGSRSL